MEREERIWFIILVVVFLIVNAVTLSPLVPWQEWLLLKKPPVSKQFYIEYEDYQIKLPPEGIKVKVGEYVEFIATSKDVTYGFGVFRKDGTMVFQMQVVPGYENKIVWKFDTPGLYDVRSTEYSGPKHPEMYIPDAIEVIQ